MNRRTSVLMAVLIVAVVGTALAVGLSGSRSATNGCKASGTPVMHKVVIQDGKVSDDQVNGRLCDTVTFTNKDNLAREIAFGSHEHHVPYDGVAERVLGKGQSFTITLNQAGNFHWHDHLHDEAEGYFTVKQ